MTVEWRNWPWDRITAAVAVFVAGFAIWVSSCDSSRNLKLQESVAESQQKFQGAEAEAARRHERMSVRPIITIVLASNSAADPAGILLMNRGLGPALLRDVTFYDGTETVARATSRDSMQLVLEHIGLGSAPMSFTWFPDYVAVPVGEPLGLITSRTPLSSDAAWQRRFAEAIRSVDVGICYCSLYEECWIELGGHGSGSTSSCSEPDYSVLRTAP